MPLLDAGGVVLIGAVGGVLALAAPPGSASVWFLLAYAAVRFSTDALRGDHRPRVLGLSRLRLMACAQARRPWR